MPETRSLVKISLEELRRICKMAEGKPDSEFVFLYPKLVLGVTDNETSVS